MFLNKNIEAHCLYYNCIYGTLDWMNQNQLGVYNNYFEYLYGGFHVYRTTVFTKMKYS